MAVGQGHGGDSRGLEALFAPRSIAVIGASRTRGSIGAEIFHNLLAHSFHGVAYPVNPHADVVQSVRAYERVTDVPGPVDLAVVVVPKEKVAEAARECARKRVKAMVVISAGFKETGEEGARREKSLLEICRKHGIRLVGPNCLGILNTDPEVCMDATFAPTYPPEGNVAFSSQSGALGLTILDYAKQLGIGISKFISVGNKADVSGNDLLRYWLEDPKTDVILLYLESFGDPQKFLRVASHVGRKKPVVAVKSGRTTAGALAAASHTGALAGSEAAARALVRQSGVIRVDTVEELFDMAMLLAHQPLPRGNRVGILTNAGGPGIMAADACESWGLKIPEISPATQKRLRKLLVPEASVRNPVDMIASARVESFEKVIPILLAAPEIDSLLVIYVPPIVTRPSDVAEAIVKGARRAKKPVLTCFMGTHGVPEGLRSLKKSHIPSYAFPEAAVAAIARAAEYSQWKRRPPGKKVTFSDMDSAGIRKLLRKPGWLPPADVFRVLSKARIPSVETRFARTPEEARSLAQKMRFPLVLKIDSPKILHKTDVGGVALDLERETDVEVAAKAMLARAKKIGLKPRDVRGFLLQPMSGGGLEVIAGSSLSGKMGRLVMFGLGGIQVEVLRDVAFRLHPLTDLDAREIIREIRGYALLRGHRGSPPYDTAALERLLLRLNHLFTLFPEIVEMDLNPIKVLPARKGALVLDARIRVQ